MSKRNNVSFKNRAKSFIRKIKRRVKKNKKELVILCVTLLIPYIVAAVHSALGKLISIEVGDVLSFYGVSLGLFLTLWLYRDGRRREMAAVIKKAKPQIGLSVRKTEDENCFLLKIKFKEGNDPFHALIYDQEYGMIKGDCEIKICFAKYQEIQSKKKELIEGGKVDIVVDKDDYMGKGKYPEYVLFLCACSDDREYYMIFDETKEEESGARFYRLSDMDLLTVEEAWYAK